MTFIKQYDFMSTRANAKLKLRECESFKGIQKFQGNWKVGNGLLGLIELVNEERNCFEK